MRQFFFDMMMSMIILIGFGTWGIRKLFREHPKGSRLAARSAWNLFRSFLR